MRTSGILLPVFSLPGKYGIGCFSKEAYSFVDQLKACRQTFWQILPMGPTSIGDSPYQSFSTFAGNPYFIDPDTLMAQGLLTQEECLEVRLADEAAAVDYGWLYHTRYTLLRKAFERSRLSDDRDYQDFVRENDFWLEDYALFMALKDHFGGCSMFGWPEEIRMRRPEAMAEYRTKLQAEMAFYMYLQYTFACQWKALKAYANARGIRIIGDIPIYVSSDSADVWAHRELFQMDAAGHQSAVAGCPPDGFSATGQLWGNPLYNWQAHAETGYDWWIRRMAKCRQMYDVIRIDHFRGFDEYFAVPAGDDTAANGHWEKGPGMALFNAIREALGQVDIIAEDLGYITDGVRQLVKDSGFPNMKILEFAFDSRDSSGPIEYLPYNYGKNHVVYTGTHDNETLVGWLGSILPEEKEAVKAYLGLDTEDTKLLAKGLIRTAHSCTADICIIPMTDYLLLGNEARINQPSTLGGNWSWRLGLDSFDAPLQKYVRELTGIYGRCAEQ